MRPCYRSCLPGALVLGVAVLLGCGGADPRPEAASPETPELTHADHVTICGSCGVFKGTAACCDPEAATCADCGLVVGSPGCCKIEKGEDVSLCRKCGHVAEAN